MKKHFYILSCLIIFTLLATNNIIAQEKKNFLQSRFNGYSETITKDFTTEKLNTLKQKLESQGLFFSFSNLKYNKHKEIIKITVRVKNKRSNSEVTFDNNNKPIPDINVGESDGIAIATKSTFSGFPKDLKTN